MIFHEHFVVSEKKIFIHFPQGHMLKPCPEVVAISFRINIKIKLFCKEHPPYHSHKIKCHTTRVDS